MKDLLVSIMGAAAAVATALILVWIERRWELALYTWMFWFVIPVGAIFAGIGAAGGFGLGALLLNRRPSGLLAMNILAVSAGTYVLIQYLDYSRQEVFETPVSRFMSFWEYWRLKVTSASLSSPRRFGGPQPAGDAPTELGRWGYALAALQVLGFSLGGFATFVWLLAKPYCERCSRYCEVKRDTTSRFPESPEALAGFLAAADKFKEQGRVAELLAFYFSEGGAVEYDKTRHRHRMDLLAHECARCGRIHMEFKAFRRGRKEEWSEVMGESFKVSMDPELQPATPPLAV
jgi:hypothetical protein